MMQFQENTRTEERMNRSMDRPYFKGPIRLPPGVQKNMKSNFLGLTQNINLTYLLFLSLNYIKITLVLESISSNFPWK